MTVPEYIYKRVSAVGKVEGVGFFGREIYGGLTSPAREIPRPVPSPPPTLFWRVDHV